MTGNELFVKALQKEGIDYLFAYPGGYAIDIFDELYKQDSIQVILPRHEQGLIHAADGYARATGRTGVCLSQAAPVPPIWSPESPLPTMTVFPWYAYRPGSHKSHRK